MNSRLRSVKPRLPLLWLVAVGVLLSGCQSKNEGATPEPQGSASVQPASSAVASAIPTASAAAAASSSAAPSDAAPGASAPPAASALGSANAKSSEESRTTQPKRKRSKGFKLLDAGAAPRRPLRLKVKAGHSELLRMSTKVVMSVSVGDQSLPPSKLPEMLMDIALKATDVKANGDVRYTYTLTNGDLKGAEAFPPQVATALRESLKKLVGLNGHAVINNRGVQKSSKLNVPKDLPPQVQQMMGGIEQGMDRIVVPFPAKAVGVGARWRQRRTIRQAGIRLRQSTRYELKEMNGDRVVCKIDIKQKAKPQAVQAAAGAKVQLLRLRSLGSGKAQLLLGRLAPLHSVIATSTDVKMGLAKQKKTMTTNTQLTVVLRAAESK
jgi:hypothetical protein